MVTIRSRAESVSPEKLNTLNKVWHVLETNYNHWTTPPTCDDSRDPRAIECMSRANLDPVC